MAHLVVKRETLAFARRYYGFSCNDHQHGMFSVTIPLQFEIWKSLNNWLKYELEIKYTYTYIFKIEKRRQSLPIQIVISIQGYFNVEVDRWWDAWYNNYGFCFLFFFYTLFEFRLHKSVRYCAVFYLRKVQGDFAVEVSGWWS